MLCQLNFYEIEIIDRIFYVRGKFIVCVYLYVCIWCEQDEKLWCYWNTLQIERHTEHLNEFVCASFFFVIALVASLCYFMLLHVVVNILLAAVLSSTRFLFCSFFRGCFFFVYLFCNIHDIYWNVLLEQQGKAAYDCTQMSPLHATKRLMTSIKFGLHKIGSYIYIFMRLPFIRFIYSMRWHEAHLAHSTQINLNTKQLRINIWSIYFSFYASKKKSNRNHT